LVRLHLLTLANHPSSSPASMSATLSTNTFVRHYLGHPIGSILFTLVGHGILGPASSGSDLYYIGCKLDKQIKFIAVMFLFLFLE